MVALLVLVLGATWVLVRPLRTEIVTESHTASIPFESQRVESAELPIGSETVVQTGKAGRKITFVYFEEKSFLGKVTSRVEIPAAGRPAETVEVTPTAEIVEFGTSDKLTVDVNASAEAGVDIGVIGKGGTLLVKATGSITYWKNGTCGPEGDPTHDYTYVPIRPNANVGALLFRVGNSKSYVSYIELAVTNGMRTVTGKPGEHVRAVVNDAAGLYADNTGAFSIRVINR